MAFPINRNLALDKKTDFDRWSSQDALEPAWDARAAIAAAFVPAGARVLDLGCGRMALRGVLPQDCTYRPCDLVARDSDTIRLPFTTPISSAPPALKVASFMG